MRQRAQPAPERQHAHHHQHARQEDRDEGDEGAREARRRRAGHRAEIGGEGEQRPRQSLGRAIARQEGVVGNPPRRHDGVAQQRQHDMAAAEHQGARAIECGEQREQAALDAGRRTAPATRRTPQAHATPRRRDAGMARSSAIAVAAAATERQPRDAAERDRADLGERTGANSSRTSAAAAIEARSRSGQRRARHAHDRLGDDGDRDELEPVQQADAPP